MSLGSPKSLVRIVAGLQDHLILLVCKTISSSWSARPVVHQSYLPADHDALVRTVAGLQDHLIFLVCKTISIFLVSQTSCPSIPYLLADHDALVRTVAGLQDHPLSSWSARPFHLLGQPDQLPINHVFLQIMMLLSGLSLFCRDHLIFLVCPDSSHLLGLTRTMLSRSIMSSADMVHPQGGGGLSQTTCPA